jgi:hypothetical protein
MDSKSNVVKSYKDMEMSSHYLTIVGRSREHLAYVAACHWILAPQLYHIFCCLFNIFIPPDQPFCMFLIACWLNLMCPITSTFDAPRQSTMSGNQRHLAI